MSGYELQAGGAGSSEPLAGPAMRSNGLIDSFRHALSGIGHVVRTQQNMRIHLILAIVVIALGIVLRLSRLEMAVLVLAIGIVLLAEMVNTAVEAIVDLASPELHSLAKVAKDAAAGGVLLAALAAAAVGVLILGPHLWGLIR